MRKFVLAAVAASVPAVASAAPVTYQGSQSTIKYNSPTTAGIGWTGAQMINPTKVIYDSATDTYTVRDTGSTTTTSTFTNGVAGPDYTNYSKTSGSVTETLKVLNKANTVLPLTYVQYGKWRRSGMPINWNNNDTYIVFGTRTTKAGMPISGTGAYTTILEGTYVNKNGVYSVSGTGNLTANFATGGLTYDMTATGDRESGGSTINFGTMSGSGSIAYGGPTFRGSGGFNGSGYASTIMGNFFGPAAEEVGGNFSIRGNSSTLAPGQGTGAFVGKK